MKPLVQNLSGFVPRNWALVFPPCKPNSGGDRPMTADVFYSCLSLWVREPDQGDQVCLYLEMRPSPSTGLDSVGRKKEWKGGARSGSA